MKISRNWLQTYFDEKIPEADKLAEIFTFHAFEVEGQETIEKNGDVEADQVLDVKVLPDRAHYALSHRGVALEVAVNTGLVQKERYVGVMDSDIDNKPVINVESPDFCRRYTARYIKLGNVPKQSPVWLKNALNSIGQRSISTIVDITNYVMYDIGQPLHAFDADKIVGNLEIRNAKAGEKIVLLDGRELELNVEDTVIADKEGALVVAGAKGGKRAEIDENTKNIIIESANFHPTKVRKTSTKYDIRSDSSKRFENEISPELAIHGMNNFCKLISEVIPGSRFGPVVDFYPNPVQKTVFEFNPGFISQRLGVAIDEATIKEILQKLGFEISPKHIGDTSVWDVVVPFERLDINSKEDLVEEVGRVYGYDKVQGILPPKHIGDTSVPTSSAAVLPIFYISELIRTTLSENGFSEVSLYSLVSTGHHETAKPLAKDKAFARAELTKGMLDCVQRNTLNADLLGLSSIKIFEIGHIFGKDAEKTHLVIGANQIKKIKGYKAEQILADTVKRLEEVLGVAINGAGVESVDKTGNIKTIEIDLDKIAKEFAQNGGGYDLNRLDIGRASTNKYQKFSLYPFIVRDIAVFVPESVGSDSVWEKIGTTLKCSGADKLLNRHVLFDTFKKDGKISYAFRMIFQSAEKTLTDEEINGIMGKVSADVRGAGWEVR